MAAESERSEPYVRLASLRRLHVAVAQLSTARSLADTLQTIADGVVEGLGFEVAAVHLVRPDGDLVVAAVAGSDEAELALAGRTASRASWDRELSTGEPWGGLRFVPYTEGRADGLPRWHPAGPVPQGKDDWRPGDRLFAPLYDADGELLGVLSVDRPHDGRRPGAWAREALRLYSSQAAAALGNARLRSDMQRALARLERRQSALRASEESFRRDFEYAPNGMAVAETGGDQHGQFVRVNDALCRLLGRSAADVRRRSFSDIVHPEDIGTLLRTSAEGGRAEVRLARRDGSYLWVSLRNSVVADTADGPRFLLTHVEDIDERKRHGLELAHRASHDVLTGLPNGAELRARLSAKICPSAEDESGADGFDAAGMPSAFGAAGGHVHLVAPEEGGGSRGLAVLFCDLDGMHAVNERYGFRAGDAVLVELARRLSDAVGDGDGDTVARFGGDEFVVLADGLRPADAQELAVRLRNAITLPVEVDGDVTVTVDASLGAAWAACGDSVEDVLKTADLRMYEEKRSRERARHVRTANEPADPERRIVAMPPRHDTVVWTPHRPAVQREFVRTWPTDGAAPSARPHAVEVGSAAALSRLTAEPHHIHRVVCRGDVADLSALARLPSLRSLVIDGNTVLHGLDALDGCRRLRSLTVSGCERLTDWSAVARSGVVFLTVSCAASAVPELSSGLVGAPRLRELRLLTGKGGEGAPDGGGPESGSPEPALDLGALHTMPRLRITLDSGAATG